MYFASGTQVNYLLSKEILEYTGIIVGVLYFRNTKKSIPHPETALKIQHGWNIMDVFKGLENH